MKKGWKDAACDPLLPEGGDYEMHPFSICPYDQAQNIGTANNLFLLP